MAFCIVLYWFVESARTLELNCILAKFPKQACRNIIDCQLWCEHKIKNRILRNCEKQFNSERCLQKAAINPGDGGDTLLGKLNMDEGTTIVMVTHDSQIASRAGRMLFLSDGRLLAKEKRGTHLMEGKLTCPYCGKEIQPDDMFCPRCGKELWADKEITIGTS